MDITVKFQKKSNSMNLKLAIKLAETVGYEEDIDYYIVKFTEPSKDLDKLFGFVGTWKATVIEVDGDEYSYGEVRDLLSCMYRKKCDGLCALLRFTGYRTLME